MHEVEQIQTDSEESSDLEFFVETIIIQDPLNINEIKNESSVWSVTLTSNGLPISYKIDTGTQGNIVPLKIYQKFNPQPDLHPVNLKLSAYNNSNIPMISKCSLTLEHKNKLFNVSFLVVDTKSVPILALQLCENLKLIKHIYSVKLKENLFLSEFLDCFGEIGTLNKIHHIEIKENFTPFATHVRQIPHSLKPKVEKELKRTVDLDIIEPVDEPTDWVNGLVIVEKPNEKPQICLDPRPLNQAIKREHLHLPIAEGLFSQMSGAKYFSKLDANSGYWQIKVDRESSNLLTFGTTIGRFQFKRLPYDMPKLKKRLSL